MTYNTHGVVMARASNGC